MGNSGHSVRPITTRIWGKLTLFPNQEPFSKKITLKTVVLQEDLLKTGSGSANCQYNVIHAVAECFLICPFLVSTK
jgi:hypothetical protein